MAACRICHGRGQRRQRAGHADRKPARHGGVARQRLSVGVEEEFWCGAGGRGLAAVDASELLRPASHENIAAAAQP